MTSSIQQAAQWQSLPATTYLPAYPVLLDPCLRMSKQQSRAAKWEPPGNGQLVLRWAPHASASCPKAAHRQDPQPGLTSGACPCALRSDLVRQTLLDACHAVSTATQAHLAVPILVVLDLCLFDAATVCKVTRQRVRVSFPGQVEDDNLRGTAEVSADPQQCLPGRVPDIRQLFGQHSRHLRTLKRGEAGEDYGDGSGSTGSCMGRVTRVRALQHHRKSMLNHAGC